MRKPKNYRLKEVTLKQLEDLENYYHWNQTELIEKAIDILEIFMVAEQNNIANGVLSLPDGEKKIFYEVK